MLQNIRSQFFHSGGEIAHLFKHCWNNGRFNCQTIGDNAEQIG